MKTWQWVCLGILSFSLVMWIMYPYFAQVPPQGPSTTVVALALALTSLHVLCALWLLVQAVRFESRPLPYLLLALFVPFACVWYYTERVRQRKQAQAQISSANLSLADGTSERSVRTAVWICLGVFSVTFAVIRAYFCPFCRPLLEELGTTKYVVVPILILQPFGGIWMLYRSIRYESKPLQYILLAVFVPFACVWYYVERVRPRPLRPD